MELLGIRECLIESDGRFSSPYYNFFWSQPVARSRGFDINPHTRHGAGLHALRADRLWFNLLSLAPRPDSAILIVRPVHGSRVVLGDFTFRAEKLQILSIICGPHHFHRVHRYWSRWVPVHVYQNRRYELERMELRATSGLFTWSIGESAIWFCGYNNKVVLEPYEARIDYRADNNVFTSRVFFLCDRWYLEYGAFNGKKGSFRPFCVTPSTLLQVIRHNSRAGLLAIRGQQVPPAPEPKKNTKFDRSKFGTWIASILGADRSIYD